MSIDYGMGQTNIDKKTGIRYGVIPANDVGEAWYDGSEPEYGPPTCPKCGAEAVDFNYEEHCEYESGWGSDYTCEDCKYVFPGDDAFGETPLSFNLDDGEYQAQQDGDDVDIFILHSKYYTKGPFCSPCAPGAVYLPSAHVDGQAKAYCFAPDWFEAYDDNDVTGEYDGQKTSCPYPVYRVVDDICVFTPKVKE